jgi:sterol desaturase/sphingolipid hydroxylase (fatty acid hydroxylase superfamily)
VVIYLTVSAASAQFEHANVRLSKAVDRWLRLLFVTPNMHKVHHSRLRPETDSNYANIFSVWDGLFGTYTSRIDFGTLRYGLDDADDRATFVGLLRMPF